MMDWQALLKTIAPWIGTAIGGPLGGMALTAAANALGIAEPTQDKLKAALSGMTAEQSLALKQADNDFSLHMAELGYKSLMDLEGLAVQDRADARAMQVATKSIVPALLATVITVAFIGILVGLMRGWLKTDDNQSLLLLLGAMAAAWGNVVNYFFGSSAGSARKDELAAGATPQK